jgi:hypothetical protein
MKALSSVVLSCLLLGQSVTPALAAAAATPAAPKPALSQADLKAVMTWIGERVAASQQPFCYKQSYGRGVGVPLSTCPANQQKNGALCYPECKAGYGGAGPVCWQECPSGYSDTGAFCHVSKSLTAAVHTHCSGKWPWQWHCSQDCPSGYTNAGLFCALNTPSNPSGWKGDGLDLIKGSYGRGAGYPLHCKDGLQSDAGLCYNYCKQGFYGVGPVCWESCPSGETDCGAGCANGKTSCGSSVANMVISPLMVVANVAAIVLTAGAGAGVTAEADAGIDAGVKGTETGVAEAAQAGKDAEATAKEAGNLDKLADAIKSKWADFAKGQGAKMDAVAAGDFWKAATSGNPALVIAKFGAKGYGVAKMTDIWLKDATGNFASMATPAVKAQMDRSFAGHPDAEKWVETQYAIVNLSQLMGQNAQQTANTALSTAGLVDPTGVASVVAAYDNPKCSNNDAFPTVHILY